MIEELERNINTEIEMLREISNYARRLDHATEEERRIMLGAIRSLVEGIKIINNSIPEMVKETAISKKLPSMPASRKKEKPKLESIKFKRIESHVDVVLGVRDKERFLRELSINEKYVRKLKRKEAEKTEQYSEFKASRGYPKLANKLFLSRASELVKKGYFKSLSIGLRKSNIDMLFESYIAMILMTVFMSFIFGLVIAVSLLFIDIGTVFPFFKLYAGSYLERVIRIFWIPLVLPILAFVILYYYPSTEQKSLGKKIDQELPFAVIHMSAISGSGIEPSEIFRIIGLNKEYPNLKKEIRKVLNQINLYGYDLVTALNNSAKTSPSTNLAELFFGLSTTITSGSNLSDFFEKRSETLLLDYRLEREKYTKLVETFLDIYISVVIAAPMIFLLLLIMMSVSGIGVGFTSAQLSIIAVFSITILNVVFLLFLQLKQPSY